MANYLILTTYKGFLMTSLENADLDNGSVRVETVERLLTAAGNHVEVHCFEEIVVPEKYRGWYVLYASSEDRGLFYKDYIEDVVLQLDLAGAHLLPRFELFRAHHNKAFMERLRALMRDERLKTIASRAYASYDSFQAGASDALTYPVVLKSAAGSGSTGVAMARSLPELKKAVKRLTKRIYWDYDIRYGYWLIEALENFYRKLRGRKKFYYMPRAEKFVVQNFIPGLGNDFKVLVFGEKFYVLKRQNRDGDFRASGSGRFVFPSTLSDILPILSFAQLAAQELDSPLCSLDIGFDGHTCHLIEFQCVNFGPYTLQRSSWYYVCRNGEWRQVPGASVLEEEIARAVDRYVRLQDGPGKNIGG